MVNLKRASGRLQRWIETRSGWLLLRLADRVRYGSKCRAGYGLRLRTAMGGQIQIGVGVTFDRWVDLFAHQCLIDIESNCYFEKGCVIAVRENTTIGFGCK